MHDSVDAALRAVPRRNKHPFSRKAIQQFARLLLLCLSPSPCPDAARQGESKTDQSLTSHVFSPEKVKPRPPPFQQAATRVSSPAIPPSRPHRSHLPRR